jgi:hypothetical protein
MKRILSSLLLLSLPFAANATLIDFDTSPAGAIASGTIITNQYSSLGVSFSASENGSPVDAWAVTQFAATAAGAGHSGNSLWNCNVGCGPRADILRMDFAAPVSNVSWYTERPAWAHSCGCKSRRKLITANEAKRNCLRATDGGKEAWSETASR